MDSSLLRALDAATASIALLRGPELCYVFANRRYREIAGFTSDPIGKPFGFGARQRAASATAETLRRVYATGEPFTADEHPIQLGPGDSTWFLNVSYQATRDADGAIDGVFICSTVVTEYINRRRELEQQREALRALQERLRTVIDAAPLAVVAVDRDLRYTEVGGRAIALSGAAADQLVGASLTERYPSSVAVARRALAGEECREQVESYGHLFESHWRPMRDAEGAVIGAVVVSVDITERARAEREREQLQAQLLHTQKLESLGLLAGGIAHDFNNMLTAMLGGASTATLMLPRESPAQAPLADVVASARRAADLTRQLLAYSGKGHFQVQPIDLSALIREVARLLEASISRKVQLRLELGDRLPAIDADAAQLQQIVMNLVINAAEAIGEHSGTVLITTSALDVDEAYARTVFAPDAVAVGRYVYLEVHDTGTGMDEATVSRIFDPFFTTKFTGRGLGLAAVLGIVRAHRGAIKVYTEPGKGSTFKVLLPASTQAATAAAAQALEQLQGDGLVLVVDDDAAVRTALGRMLRHFGFEVVEAGDGRDGVALFRAHAGIRLVVLDMTMPVMSGEETFRELRAIRDDVPVVLSSGYNEIEATRRFVAKGIAGFLQKPFTPTELSRAIVKALGPDLRRKP